MWMLLIVFVAAVLALTGLPETRVRLLILPVVLMLVAYEALKSGLL